MVVSDAKLLEGGLARSTMSTPRQESLADGNVHLADAMRRRVPCEFFEPPVELQRRRQAARNSAASCSWTFSSCTFVVKQCATRRHLVSDESHHSFSSNLSKDSQFVCTFALFKGF